MYERRRDLAKSLASTSSVLATLEIGPYTRPLTSVTRAVFVPETG